MDQPVIGVLFRIQIQKLASWLQLVCGSSKVLAFSFFTLGSVDICQSLLVTSTPLVNKDPSS